MNRDLRHEIAALLPLTVGQLRQRYADVFGETTNTGNKTWLVKRIAWRLQASALGGLSERARQRATDLAQNSQIRTTLPRQVAAAQVVTPTAANEGSLPLPGQVLTRSYKGRLLQVTVRNQGFEFGGKIYRSLSAVAKAVTGSHTSGNLFFGLAKRGDA